MTRGPGGTGAPLVDVAEATPRVLALAAAPPPLLVVSDFDGTLSRIAPEPTGAAILPAVRRALRRLAAVAERRPGRLAVAMLSGRTAADLAARVRVGGCATSATTGSRRGRRAAGGPRRSTRRSTRPRRRSADLLVPSPEAAARLLAVLAGALEGEAG